MQQNRDQLDWHAENRLGTVVKSVAQKALNWRESP